MFYRALGAIALLCLLAGCVTSGSGDTTRVSVWKGIDVTETVPPLEIVAASNRAQAQGRVRAHEVDWQQLEGVCQRAIETDEGILQGCTVRTGPPSNRQYDLYVHNDYPAWFRKLIALHESGHAGQAELGLPYSHAGYGSPTVDLIQRLGG